MRIEGIRVQHFQCVIDSGKIPIDDRVTTLVGENESGKSAILRALEYFNRGMSFDVVDLSTLEGILPELNRGAVQRSNLEMVSIWVRLSSDEIAGLGLDTTRSPHMALKVTKTLDNSYHIYFSDDTPLRELVGRGSPKLLELLKELRSTLSGIYRGRVKAKEPMYTFVFLEQREGEKPSENLILFPQYFASAWEDLHQEDWVQVFEIGVDFLGRNRPAERAAPEYDLLGPTEELIRSLEERTATGAAVMKSLEKKIGEMPEDHPLKPIATKALGQLAKVAESPEKTEVDKIERAILEKLPTFQYIPDSKEVSNTLPILKLTPGAQMEEGEALLATLTEASKWNPEIVAKSPDLARSRVLRAWSDLISRGVGSFWSKELKLDLRFPSAKELAIYVEAGGSEDPPSRRSRGLASYLALIAKLSMLSATQNFVLLLDDPCLYLHPMAQKNVLKLLEIQQYQIILSTHLPFMVYPDHLERIFGSSHARTSTEPG